MRHLLNTIIGNKSTSNRLSNEPELLRQKQTEASDMILKLLKKPREKMNPVRFEREYHWDMVSYCLKEFQYLNK